MYAPEDIADELENRLSKERLAELRNGRPFNDDEWRQVKEVYDFSESDRGTAVVAFETNDALGRSMYFVAEYGDWGTYLGCSGPYSESEDLLASYTEDDDTIFEEVDGGWEAFTPNWIEEATEEEATEEVPQFVIEEPSNSRTTSIDLLSYEYPNAADTAFPNCPLVNPPFGRVSINDIDFFRTEYSLKLREQFPFGSTPKTIIFEDKQWFLAERLEIRWHKGRFHLGDLHLKSYWDGFPLHFHCDLNVSDENFHLDLYGIGHWGPGSSRIDILVFKEASLVARGSNGNQSIASFSANLPLAFPTKHGLAVIPKIDFPKDAEEATVEITYWRVLST